MRLRKPSSTVGKKKKSGREKRKRKGEKGRTVDEGVLVTDDVGDVHVVGGGGEVLVLAGGEDLKRGRKKVRLEFGRGRGGRRERTSVAIK
jgi:hypothetical protein